MLISKKWLQSYFKNELPSMQKISDTLLLHSFEIEGLEEKNDDWVLDVDVLPNRAHDCLCHEGVAREIAGLIGRELLEERFSPYHSTQKTKEKISVKFENRKQCLRYTARLIENIEVRESPDWLKNRIASMGQKSINAIVDATNFILFDIGQPMHVFDADKVNGSIVIRNAISGEKMLNLTGEEIILTEDDLVVADEEKVLAIAGVKGGKAAELTKDTKNIIIESANFNPITTRKTARRIKIFTDASKRYENGITSEKTIPAIHAITSLLMELAITDLTKISPITDIYPNPEEKFTLELDLDHISRLLGFSLKEEDVNEILDRFQYTYIYNKGVYRISIPYERLDLRIPEDMIEEIGRLYGYHNIPIASVDNLEFSPKVNKLFYISQMLRNYFIKNGFIEIMNYTFVNKGEVDLFNPLASDKKSLRKNLYKQMKESLEKNSRVSDFVNVEQILNFEIDNIHTKDGEKTVCCFGINTLSKKTRKKYGDEQKQIDNIISELTGLFNIEKLNYIKEGNIVQFELDQFREKMIDISYLDMLKEKTYKDDAVFNGISIYPYIKRDISFWIKEISAKEIKISLEKLDTDFLQKVYLFDEFEKEGKTSYAFTLIFQSFEKTLTDEEVNKEMGIIEEYVKSIGGEIR